MNFLELRRPWRQAHSLRDDSPPVGPVGCLDDSKNAKSNCLMGNYICMEDGNELSSGLSCEYCSVFQYKECSILLRSACCTRTCGMIVSFIIRNECCIG